MDMHQLLARARRVDQGVAPGGHLAQTRADGQDQIAFANALCQFGVDTDTHVTRVERMVVVKRVLKPKGVAHWQFPVLGKALQCLGGLHRPATATSNHNRFLRL